MPAWVIDVPRSIDADMRDAPDALARHNKHSHPNARTRTESRSTRGALGGRRRNCCLPWLQAVGGIGSALLLICYCSHAGACWLRCPLPCRRLSTAAAAVAELARTHTDDPTAAAPTAFVGLPVDLVGGCGAVLAVCAVVFLAVKSICGPLFWNPNSGPFTHLCPDERFGEVTRT